MSARRVRGLLVAAVLSAACTAAGVRAGPSLAPEAAAAQGERPNIVVVMTDDQTDAAMELMPSTQALLAEAGTTFENSYVNFPLCCPARATFLTGQYAHNHGILDNTPPAGGFDKFHADHGDDNLATWLEAAGYTNGYVGTASLAAGERKTLELELSKKKLRKVRRAMKSPQAKAKAKLEVVASGPAGGTDSATRAVKLRP
jgi:N-acetylglucosamine-6-sulfatase